MSSVERTAGSIAETSSTRQVCQAGGASGRHAPLLKRAGSLRHTSWRKRPTLRLTRSATLRWTQLLTPPTPSDGDEFTDEHATA